MFGFLYRATLGSAIQFLRRRLPLRGLWKNWAAALKLPLLHLGLAKDFWEGFDGYMELGEGAAATYFVIPFPNRAGQGAPGSRAAAYGAASLSSKLQALHAAGCEIGLHGIDAWNSASHASAEAEEIRRITGERETGVRMHWLYYSHESPAHLEEAGIVYDSTVGYNQTVGFRAGTAQVYRPLETRQLLEIPLHVMDTALFYPGYLNLSPDGAWKRVKTIIRSAVELGGCVTVNWHDRSIAPERQWGQFYRRFIEEMRIQGARFCTAAQTAAWFRMRRSVVFESVAWEPDRVRARIGADYCAGVPGLQLRVHQAENSCLDVPIDRETAGAGSPGGRCSFVLDVSLGNIVGRHAREAGDPQSVPCTRVN
jgi:peptidoglycan/xylan/chitin deacetylase (PgdA/CDA1 family)